MSQDTNKYSPSFAFSLSMKALLHTSAVASFLAIDGNRSLFASRPIKAGQVIDVLPLVSVQDKPTRFTVQTGAEQHIDIGEMWACGNHSCSPSILFDTTRMLVTATRDIKEGEELTFFYPSTEWDMAEPFLCHCGADGCLQHISGARYLQTPVLMRYFLNEHILAMVSARDAQDMESLAMHEGEELGR
ncbi:MAG: SET domain-containing protein [Myxococcales bacterium]|nr:SET domain-containing protein [Myxococcales bacterium]